MPRCRVLADRLLEVIENAGELGPWGPEAAEGRMTRSDRGS